MNNIIKQQKYNLLLCCALLSGCASQLKIPPTLGDGYSLYSRTAATSNLIIMQKNGPYIFCSEPEPDAVYEQDNGLSFSLALVKTSDNSNLSEQSQEIGLGGISSNVLLTRETFYRACEFLANTNLSNEQKLSLFNNTLDTIKSINTQSLGNGTQNQTPVSTAPVNQVTPAQ